MAEWWMLSGTTSTAVGANQPVMVGQSAEVTTVEVAACGVGTEEIANSAVTAGKLGALSVTSEKASANLVKRTATVNFGSTFGTGYASTGLPLWKAPTPVVITHIETMAQQPWILTSTTDLFTFWSCVAGTIMTYQASEATVLGTVGNCLPSTGVSYKSTGLNLAACEIVRLYATFGVNTCAQAASFQIDYVTSG